jgi:hypothetical protein
VLDGVSNPAAGAPGHQLPRATLKRGAGTRIPTRREPRIQVRSVQAHPDSPQGPGRAYDARHRCRRSGRRYGHP